MTTQFEQMLADNPEGKRQAALQKIAQSITYCQANSTEFFTNALNDEILTGTITKDEVIMNTQLNNLIWSHLLQNNPAWHNLPSNYLKWRKVGMLSTIPDEVTKAGLGDIRDSAHWNPSDVVSVALPWLTSGLLTHEDILNDTHLTQFVQNKLNSTYTIWKNHAYRYELSLWNKALNDLQAIPYNSEPKIELDSRTTQFIESYKPGMVLPDDITLDNLHAIETEAAQAEDYPTAIKVRDIISSLTNK